MSDGHSFFAGDLAQDWKNEEIQRRQHAKKTADRYLEQKKLFGTKYVRVLTQQITPARFTPKEWEEEYAELFPLLDKSTREFLEKEKEPTVVTFSQTIGKPIQLDHVNKLVFRGDSRPPSVVFRAGFARIDLETEVSLGSETTSGGISTSDSADVVRRKYGNAGNYVYVCWLGVGIDTHDFNKLNEIIALHIQPEWVIGAAGPITQPSLGDGARLIVGNVVENPSCSVGANDKSAAMKALNDICSCASVTRKGAYEMT
jgi:hypothetical protein